MTVTVTQSEIVEDITQVDGRRSVTEHHVTSAGRLISVSYLAEPDADIEQRMLGRVQELNDQFASMEEANATVEGGE